ncbi:hypothetical protein [Corallococcus exercitus]|uniref:Phospholipase n=1 Tax=Corallococcus exercitus TaxID=2316736 RepID=A0A7Y4JQA3_9BACT|nr:hypothetical protein [Corallococcus exercitus]NOK08969.1 hypothetical protein [Corallococcus exercitus]
MAATDKDPLRAFLDVRTDQLGGAKPFEGGEHLWVGNEGAKRALAQLKTPVDFGPFQRRTSPEQLTYGEIVAFSGDFYETPGDLFNEAPSSLPWLWDANDLSDLRKALRKETSWIDLPLEDRGTRYPDLNVALWWNAKQYVELALRNTPHFGWHNALHYACYHETALELAAKAASEPDATAKNLLWREAVYTNGFADHFLTDGFSAGHVRTPVAQLRRWAAKQGMDERLSGALIKVIHDQDGHIDELHSKTDHKAHAGGLHVTNALGNAWHTRCDGQLFLTGPKDPAVEQAVEAVADSVGELLRAYQGEGIVQGAFAATQWIPWPHDSEPALITKFPADIDNARVKALYDSIRWYVRLPKISAGIRPGDIKDCCAQLPQLMQDFRDDVSRQALELPALVSRLAPKYVAGYRTIR